MNKCREIALSVFLVAIGLSVLIGTIALLWLVVQATWVGFSHSPEKEVERLEQNIRHFDWASPECVEQEVGSGDPKNQNIGVYETKLRFCELEKRVAGIEGRE